MKQYIVAISLITILTIHASEPFPKETTFKWSGPSKFPAPSLEIRNKDNYPIEVTVVNAGKEQNFLLGANKSKYFEKNVPVVRLRGLDLSKETKIFVVFNPHEDKYREHIYFIEPGHHIFVSWEEQNLRPQKGAGGKTQSGINLKTTNNVTKKILESKKGTRDL